MAKIMVQGTTSSAGKSTLVTGLMRYFKNAGLRVFPFKSQNMSSKCFVNKNGKKIATAQALQAFAGRLEPSPEMNPVLLMPSSDMGSMVVIGGDDYKHMEAREYFAYKKELIPCIKDIFDKIESENDLVIIEGAGSPAEINLRENDIVNMGLAELVDSPVILVADIDRGGVFASLYGTYMLLSESERKRIKGFVINKFRGDPELLKSGVEKIEEMTGVKVIGLIPYTRLEIADEDSLIDYDKKCNHGAQSDEELDSEIEKLAKTISENMDMEYLKRVAGVNL